MGLSNRYRLDGCVACVVRLVLHGRQELLGRYGHINLVCCCSRETERHLHVCVKYRPIQETNRLCTNLIVSLA